MASNDTELDVWAFGLTDRELAYEMQEKSLAAWSPEERDAIKREAARRQDW